MTWGLLSSLFFPVMASLSPLDIGAIQKILKPYKGEVGVSIRALSGKEIWAKNGDQNLTPASIAKLMSSACALEELGANYKFKTSFGYIGSISKGVLKGDLVVKAGGDPSYVIEDLERDIEALFFIHGLRQITGSLLFDTSIADEPRFKPFEGFEGDRGRAFTSLLTPLAINHNAFAIWISVQEGTPHVKTMPAGAIKLKKLENTLKVIPGRYRGSRMNLDFRPEFSYLKVSGTFGLSDPPKGYYRAHPDPYASFSNQFARVWAANGGKWNGTYKVAAEPQKAVWLHTDESRSLSRIFIDINKFSTNFAAEMTLMAAASKYYKKKSNPNLTAGFIQACLGRNGIEKTKMNLENASGLSRDSLLQASALTQFLSGLRSKIFFPEYLSTLSVLGIDGTTRSRLKKYSGEARLKTGTLNGVNTVAGYVFPKKADPFSVAILLNCKSCGHQKMRRDQDKILKILLDQ